MNAMSKESKRVTKKEARTYLQRLKLFAHFILSKTNNKLAIGELIHLCHEILS